MSQDPPDPSRQTGIPRRSVLKYLGAAFGAALLPESLIACTTEAAGVALVGSGSAAIDLAGARILDVVRPTDLVALRFVLVNLDKDATGTLLTRVAPGPAYIVLVFPPQHVLEPAQPEGSQQPYYGQARAGAPSRVAFDVPDSFTSTAYTLPALLALCEASPLNVSPNAAAATATAASAVGAPLPGAAPRMTPASASTALSVAKRKAIIAKRGAVTPHRLAATTRGAARARAIAPLPASIPTKPDVSQTAIELPHRLVLSPSALAGFAHATEPVVSPLTSRVELWHSRLGGRDAVSGAVDERALGAMTMRALWTRDAGFDPTTEPDPSTTVDSDPFAGSALHSYLHSYHREAIVHLTSNFAKYPGAPPLSVDRLSLSALGGSLDITGDFPQNASLVRWMQQIRMGRDQHVEVVSHGIVLPACQKAVRFELCQRNDDPSKGPIGSLLRKTILLFPNPAMSFDAAGDAESSALTSAATRFNPFRVWELGTTHVEGRISADGTCNDDPLDGWLCGLTTCDQQLVSAVGTDFSGTSVSFAHPIYFVTGDPNDPNPSSAFDAQTRLQKAIGVYNAANVWLSLGGARVSYADGPTGTAFNTASARLQLDISPDGPFFSMQPEVVFWAIPHLKSLVLDVPALRQLAGGVSSTTFDFHPQYVASGFDPAGNPAEMLFGLGKDGAGNVGAPLPLSFAQQKDKSGGFLSPDMTIDGLSRKLGQTAGASIAAGTFDPTQFFAGAKLFGIVDLAAIVQTLGLASGVDEVMRHAPKAVTEVLDGVQRLLNEAAALEQKAASVLAQVSTLQAQLAQIEQQQPPPAQQAVQAAQQAIDALTGQVQSVGTAIAKVAGDIGSFDVGALPADANQLFQALNALFGNPVLVGKGTAIVSVVDGVRQDFNAQVQRVQAYVATADQIGSLVSSVAQLKNGAELVKDARVRLTWQPKIQPYPNASSAVFVPNNPEALLLAVEVRAKAIGNQQAGADVLARLDAFDLHFPAAALQPGGAYESLFTLSFDHLQFKKLAGQKPDVEAVFQGIHFGGCLKFIETLKNMIPLDGFSDPPYVNVDSSHIAAGFTASLPNVAVGMLSLENVKVSAELAIPFVGDSPMTFAFRFGEREHPFTLTVSMLGGGGYFGIGLSPMNGIDWVEASLEAVAQVAVDLGVAAGSVTAGLGIYFNYVAATKSLGITGYLQLSGNVSVLGLVTVSIELRMSLGYDGSKVVGQATISVRVDLFMFHETVSISCERKFGGANGDPTFAELMAPDPALLVSGVFMDDPWTEYVTAYAA